MRGFAKFCLVLFHFGVFQACAPDVVPFRPVVSTEKGYTFDEDIEEGFYENLEIVLEHYGVEYQVEDKVIYIDATEYGENLELMMNYTVKARDRQWLEGRKLEK